MGNAIQNLDKRTARRQYRDVFQSFISSFRQSHISKNIDEINNHNIHFDSNCIRVCIRKRPLFAYEYEDGEFDVVSCKIDSNTSDKVIIHDCRMHSDMMRRFIQHHSFQFDYVFPETASNESIYTTTTSPLIQKAMLQQSYSTVLVYGQTGSGKVR